MNMNAGKRTIWMAAVLAVAVMATLPLQAEDNLVKNGDFSQGEAHWQMNDRNRNRIVAGADGAHFARFQQDDPKALTLIQQIVEMPERVSAVRISARMRVRDIAGEGHAQMQYYFLGEDGQITGGYKSMGVGRDAEAWTETGETVTVPEDARRLALRPGLYYVTGTLEVDQVGVYEEYQMILREPRETEHAQPMLDPVAPVTGSPEWLEVFADFDHTLRVDPNDPQALPTIGAAIEQAGENRRNRQSTRILIAAATYREPDGALLLHDLTDPSSRAVIVIEAEQPGTVIVSGSEVFTEWRGLADMPGIYVHDWDKNWGFQRHWWGQFNTRIGPLGLRRENIWINGERQRQALLERHEQLVAVRSTPQGPVAQENGNNSWVVRAEGGPRRPYSDLEPGTFYVDDQAGLLVLRPKPGVGLNAAAVEVSTKTVGMAVNRSENLVLRGLTFQHFANTFALAIGSEALRHRVRGGDWNGIAFRVSGSRNLLLEDIVSRENNMQSVQLSGNNDVTFRRLNASDNGGPGIGGGGGVNVLFEDVTANRNNWRGHWGNFIGWHQAGIKLTRLDGVTFRNIQTRDNLACGFWFDVHAIDVHINNLESTGNLHAGAYMEMFGGPVEMVNATLENNGMGLLLSGAANFALKNSRIVGNATQITTRNDFRYHPVNFLFENNVIASRADTFGDLVVQNGRVLDGKGDQRIPGFQYWVPDIEGFGVQAQPFLMPDTNPRTGDLNAWELFIDTLQARGNTWYHPTLRHAFLNRDRWPVDFDAWVELTGDTEARWHNPVGETQDWRKRTDAVSALEKPEREEAPGLGDYTLNQSPDWPEDGALRINAGASEDWTDPDGRVWRADINNENGELFTGVGEQERSITRRNLLEEPPQALAATGLAPIYASERYLLDGYLVSVPVGSYTLRLHFSENHSPVREDMRQMSVLVNGETAIERLDVVAEAGGHGRPLVKEIKGVKPEPFVDEATAVLPAGQIEIRLARPPGAREATMINAIEIIRE